MVTMARDARNRAASFTDGDLEIVVARPDVGPDAVSASATLLSDRERERARRFAFDPDRNRFIVARALLRQLLAARLGERPEAVELASGSRGKPALAGRFATSDLRFNVSHCKDVAVYALSSGREVGVDVEAVRTLPDADDVAARWFSPRECRPRRRADRLARRLTHARRSPHGGARRPVLARCLSIVVRDRTPPEAATHYSGAKARRQCCTAPRATPPVAVPFGCATIR